MDPFANWDGNAASRAQAEAISARQDAQGNAAQISRLKKRVKDLETTVSDLLTVLEEAGIIEVQPPEE